MFMDAFLLMDRLDNGAVRRSDFMWALSAHGTSRIFQKIIRKTGCSAYFHSTAEDLTREEFTLLSFPSATASDLERMRRWAELGKARFLMERDDFRGIDSEMGRVFELLVAEEEDGLALTELVRSQILTVEELREALPVHREFHPLSFAEFLEFLRPLICAKYCLKQDGSERSNIRSRSTSRGLPPLPSPSRRRKCGQSPCYPGGNGSRSAPVAHLSCATEMGATDQMALASAGAVC